jgi:hypothetical protein
VSGGIWDVRDMYLDPFSTTADAFGDEFTVLDAGFLISCIKQ